MSAVLMAALAAVAFALSIWLTRALANPRSPLYLLDHPNERSLHQEATPRGGGLAVLSAVAVALALAAVLGAVGLQWWPLAGGALVVAVVSYVDDRRGLPAWLRLGVHLLAASLWVAVEGPLTSIAVPGSVLTLPPLPGAVAAALFLVWMTNLYNFMDGMDGFAGGMGTIGFATLAVLGAGAPDYAVVALVIAAACAGFTVLNFPPARIFMGDVGASTLGFVAGALILFADQARLVPGWIGLLVFAPFVVDASVTLARRALAGERIWRAHRSHFYQRLVGLGWSHRRTVLWEYGLMALSAGAALLASSATLPVAWSVAGGMALTYTSAMLLVTRMESRRSASASRRGAG